VAGFGTVQTLSNPGWQGTRWTAGAMSQSGNPASCARHLLYLTSFYIFHIFNGYFAFHDESFIQFEISELTLAHELK
jgi:hypothetical protein